MSVSEYERALEQRIATLEAERDSWRRVAERLEAEKAELVEMLRHGVAELEHIGIAGSYDNLFEGQQRAVRWLMSAKPSLTRIENE